MLDMTRIRPEYLDPETANRLLAADILVAEEEDEDDEEEEEEEKQKEENHDEIEDDEDDDDEGYSVIRNDARPAWVTKSGAFPVA